MLDTTEQSIVPFLKWAGGKRWLTSGYEHLFPKKFERYFEPFLGGGAVFFFLQPSKAVLSDRNADLINVYSSIKENWKAVAAALRRHDRNHGKDYYYDERGRRRHARHERAAQFLYLNRTCWNGLYRVNLRGEFNVPIGTKNTVLLDTDDFEAAAVALSSAKLRVSDFELILDEAERGDFAFIDPPYITAHNFNGFIKYNEKLFSWDDQIRLKDTVQRASRRGVKVLMTNADHSSVRNLYSGLGSICSLRRASVIAGSSEFRNPTTELLVKTYS
jgi:DNA adenine methylase